MGAGEILLTSMDCVSTLMLEILGNLLAMIGGVVLAFDALSAIRANRRDRTAKRLDSTLKLEDVTANVQANLAVSRARASTRRAVVGSLLMVAGFLLELVGRLWASYL